MRLVLVRHGQAGRKDRWQRPDRLRPLDAGGFRQADQLVDLVTGTLRPTRILSSPYVRCLQSVAPLAEATGLDVEVSDLLRPTKPRAALGLLRKLARDGRSGLVVCTHREVLCALFEDLAGRDHVRPDHRTPGPKGCVWELEARRGDVVGVHFVGAPSPNRPA